MTTLFVEAFGQLSRDANLRGMILEEEEDLHSVFRERAELMGWLTTPEGHPRLWAMEEAELTSENDAPRIGWAQVGLEVDEIEPNCEPPEPDLGRRHATLPGLVRRYTTHPGVVSQRASEPVEALPALIQCFDDSLRRFGAVEVSGFQVTASGLETGIGDRLGYLGSVLNWFNIDSKTSADAIVAFDQALLKDDDVHKLVAGLRRRKHGTFEFSSVVDVPEVCRVEVTTSAFLHAVTAQTNQGVLVSLPEWTPSAAGWVLARIMDAGRKIRPDASSLAIRITRV